MTKKEKKEKIENNAYMILSDLAIGFIKENKTLGLVVINLKNIDQSAKFALRGNMFILNTSNMSKENTYKAMFFIERNKESIVGDIEKWANT